MKNVIGKLVRFDADGKIGLVVGLHGKKSAIVVWDCGRAIIETRKMRKA